MSQQPPNLHIIGQYGEALMQSYLESHNVPFVREPVLLQTSRKIDFAVTSTEGLRVLVEVKTIWNPPPQGASAFDPHSPIRRHIAEAARQFSHLPDTNNVIALAVFPGSFVDVESPHVMLGAMYGDMALSFPFNTMTGQGDANAGQWRFVPGRGKMVHKKGQQIQPRNSRIAALVSLHAGASFSPHFGGREQISFAEYARQAIEQVSTRPPSSHPYITLWENAGAKVKVPDDLFTGDMDMRWGVNGQNQIPTFVGVQRAKTEHEST